MDPRRWPGRASATQAKQLAGLAAGGVARRVPRQHARDLADPLLALDPLDARVGAAALLDLVEAELPFGLAGDDREVGDAQHLADLPEPGETFADGAGDRAADAGVYLIEQEGVHAVLGRDQRLERQHDARGLAARGDAHQRPRLLARVGREAELDLVGAAGRR